MSRILQTPWCEAQTSPSWRSETPNRVAQIELAQSPLVAVLDQPADRRVEHRDRLQRRRRGAIRRVLIRPRRDLG